MTPIHPPVFKVNTELVLKRMRVERNPFRYVLIIVALRTLHFTENVPRVGFERSPVCEDKHDDWGLVSKD